jgi:hypothetical protein
MLPRAIRFAAAHRPASTTALRTREREARERPKSGARQRAEAVRHARPAPASAY